MTTRLFASTDSRALTALRLALGVVMAAHGAQKLFGWFGGYGFGATLGFFGQQLGIPAFLAVLVIVAEFFGGLALILGFLTRIGAAGIAAVMLGAVYFSHWQTGFFMNWSGQQAGEGFEFHILAIAMAAALVALGGGWASADRWIAGRLAAQPAQPVPVELRRAA